MTSKGCVFLTGGSGVVGQALLRELAAEEVVCLRHRSAAPVPSEAQVEGDLRESSMGLGRATFRSLATRVGAVVHSAAITDFSADPLKIERVNRDGTERALELAAAAGVPFHYLSTAFVAAASIRLNGSAKPSMFDRGLQAYLSSKTAGEELVRESGLPGTIVRPSLIIGDSRDGRIAHFRGPYLIASLAVRNLIPVVPARPDARLDFLPQDVVARAIAGIVRAGLQRGEFWIAAGERAVRVADFLDMPAKLAAQLGRRVDAPRVVPPDMVDRLIRPVFMKELPAPTRRRLEYLLTMTRMFEVGLLPSSLAELERRLRVDLDFDLRAATERSLAYWVNAQGLGRKVVKSAAG